MDGWLIGFLPDILRANSDRYFCSKNNFCSLEAIYHGIIVIFMASQVYVGKHICPRHDLGSSLECYNYVAQSKYF